jgi:hypothetical protein
MCETAEKGIPPPDVLNDVTAGAGATSPPNWKLPQWSWTKVAVNGPENREEPSMLPGERLENGLLKERHLRTAGKRVFAAPGGDPNTVHTDVESFLSVERAFDPVLIGCFTGMDRMLRNAIACERGKRDLSSFARDDRKRGSGRTMTWNTAGHHSSHITGTANEQNCHPNLNTKRDNKGNVRECETGISQIYTR